MKAERKQRAMISKNDDEKIGKVILAVAPNGSRKSQADHPAVPLTVEDMVREAPSWRDAGVSILHLHVRDREGRHSLDSGLYQSAIAALRERLGRDMVIQITTEAAGLYDAETQMAVVREVRPEAVSIALREIAPTDADQKQFADFIAWMRREAIAPQIILYDRHDLDRLIIWGRKGVIDPAQLSVLYVLGRYSTDPTSNPVDLLAFLGIDDLPFRDWMVCAFGPNESRCAALAALLGGHVRVGFENNIHLPDGSVAKSNAELIGATVSMLGALHAPLADADDVRSLWCIA